MEIVTNFVEKCTEFISLGGPIVGYLLLVIESLIPMIPLSIIVALNVNAFGVLFGILISWLGTCSGAFLCYSIFYYLSNKYLYKFLSSKMKIRVERALEKFNDISFTSLVLVMTLPFTPACVINITSGIANISRRKFIISTLIGKVFTTIFWAYIGKSFIESMTDLKVLGYLTLALLIAYVVSKIAGKKLNIE